MWAIIFVFFSGTTVVIPQAEDITSQEQCEERGLEDARAINRLDFPDKIEKFKCVRNA